MFKEFKDFIAGGNLLDLAVAFIMGGLFSGVVEALVTNLIMPIIGIPFGKPNFDQAMLFAINGSEIKVGAFLTVAVGALITAAGVFLMIVKPYNALKARMKAEAEAAPAPATPSEAELLGEIRDLLAGRISA